MMRLLAISDMHGDLTNLWEGMRASHPDLLLCCGDWGDPGMVTFDAFQSVLSQVPVLTVYGNHDDVNLLSALRNTDGSLVLLPTGHICQRDGLIFAGISGIWAKSHRKPYYITDEDTAHIAAELAGKGVDVLMSHGCPIGLADAIPGGRHGGQRSFLNAFHVISPRLYLCGHLHVPQERTLKDGCIIINVGYTCKGDYWVIDVAGKSIEAQHYKL